MEYRDFCDLIREFIKPLGIKATFRHDNGRHYANLSDGGTIIGNSQTLYMEYKTFNGSRYHIKPGAMAA